MKQQIVSKKVIFALIIFFGLIIAGLGIIYGVGIFGEPKNPQGINSEAMCREKGGKVLKGEIILCQLPQNDSFRIDE